MIRKFMEREKGKTEGKSEDRLSEAINNHFRTHPPAKKRLEALEKLAK
jgi:Zn-dependent protease with chaperone function